MNDEKWQLSRLLDVSKLRTLRVLNDPNHGRIRRSAYENIDIGIFDGITALEELSMECYNQDALRLLLYLTSMKTFPTKQSCESFEQAISTNSFQVVQATQDPSGGSILKFPLVSRELVISLISNLDERFLDKPWNAPEYQWEELGVGYINWVCIEFIFVAPILTSHKTKCKTSGTSPLRTSAALKPSYSDVHTRYSNPWRGARSRCDD